MFCPTCRRHYAEGFRHCPEDGAALGRSARITREFLVDPFVSKVLDGRYRIDRRIGEGRVGVVYAGHHVNLDKPVALKVLRREMSNDSGAIRRFSQEAKAASRVGHPAIADVTDFGEHQEQIYFVMEYLEGRTLEQVLRDDGRLPPAQVVRICRQVARGVHAAHAKGIVHRDLKPANIFLQEQNGAPERVKILDFGLAKVSLQPRNTMLGAFMGSPEYVAPELAGGGETDGRADVYSLGVILYEMLSGRVPFRGPTATRTLQMQIQDPIPPLEPDLGVPERLQAIIWQAMQKSPSDRFASMAALDGALAAAEARLAPPAAMREPEAPPLGATVLAAPLPEPEAEPARPATRARRAGPSVGIVALGLMAASLLGASFGVWLARSHDPAGTASAAPLVRVPLPPEPPPPKPGWERAEVGKTPATPAAAKAEAAPTERAEPERRRATASRSRSSRRSRRSQPELPQPTEATSEARPTAPGLMPFPDPQPREKSTDAESP